MKWDAALEDQKNSRQMKSFCRLSLNLFHLWSNFVIWHVCLNLIPKSLSDLGSHHPLASEHGWSWSICDVQVRTFQRNRGFYWQISPGKTHNLKGFDCFWPHHHTVVKMIFWTERKKSICCFCGIKHQRKDIFYHLLFNFFLFYFCSWPISCFVPVVAILSRK